MNKNFKYLTREGFKNIWANRLMSVASIGVLVACMVIIGIAIILTSNLNVAMNSLEKENVVMAYLNDKNSVLYPIDGSKAPDNKTITDDQFKVHNDEEAKAVCKEIEKLPNVEKVEYISAEKALQNYKDLYANGDSQYITYFEGDENPMSMSAKITLSDLQNFDNSVASIKNVSGVHTVTSANDVAERILHIKNAIEIAGLWIVVILMIIALVIVSNTIRVTMYNRKLEISIMKAVGATDWFIRWPFLIEGVLLGVFSSLLSIGLTYAIYSLAGGKIKAALETNALVPFRNVALEIFGIYLGIGVLAGIIGSIIILTKYLKKEGSDFRAL